MPKNRPCPKCETMNAIESHYCRQCDTDLRHKPEHRGEEACVQRVGGRTGAALVPEVGRAAGRAERERWIRRFVGNFGEPGCLSEYRAGTISFRTLQNAALRMAELMLAEVQSCHSCAFDDEEEEGGGESSVATEPRHSPTD